ncbi:RHS repeat-associated core domain-containing protein [Pseudomonas sp. T1.Ur]|uniref:RHS repeat-associated core domain-containing protein n=1 Tax=Pseudomonas sp. T1.Ur TaxID=2928704 RepID=UPI00201DCFE7|nr:RHS repeat-associated core domain-containing protein [Pseudomonas sp. T1.Ur]MCL6705191.1 RHS repeat-associated core domain-containing protein [Pseudomonas sp. T1.Ur]
MSYTTETLLCGYHYDPLDRLADCTPSSQDRTQRFYLKERLTSEIQGSVQRSIFQQDDQLLAQQQRQDDAVETTLLATDQQRSVLRALDATQPHPLAYTPYGHRAPENGLLSLLGFNGERPDPVTGHYLLGNGYRAFNPVLMRFNSPDSWSPFGEGGLNAYTYCLGNPVNRVDPTGKISFSLLSATLQRLFKSHIDKLFGITRKPIKNYRSIAKGVAIFEDTTKKNMNRLTVVAHGGPPIKGKFPYIIANDKSITPAQLHFRLKNRVNLEKYDSIRTLVCSSADGEKTFGSTLSELTGKPVKAFSGRVLTGPTQTPEKTLPSGSIDNTVTEYMVVKNRYLGRLFNYRPKTFIAIRNAP